MSRREPDWTIRIPGSEPDPLTARQRDLLVRLGAALPTSRRDAPDPSVIETTVSSIVRELVASGLSAERIADHSRLRPPFVAKIVSRGS